MKILLTGATGFVGSKLLETFSKQHEFYALGRRIPEGLDGSVELISCDFADPSALSDLRTKGGLPDSIDAVVHMAVSRLHRDFPDSAIDLFSVNCWALQQLLEYARNANASRFVLGSTCSVYDGMPTDRETLESDNPSPTRYWPATKYAADEIALKYSSLFPVSVLRFATPFGPGQYDRLIPELIRRVKNDIPVSLPENSEGIVMRPIFVDDTAAIVHTAIQDKWDGIYNVAGEGIYSLKAIGLLIGEIMGKEVMFDINPNAPKYAVIPSVKKLMEKWQGPEFLEFKAGLSATIDAAL